MHHATFLVALFLGQTATDPCFYVYQGRDVPLTLDARRLAVRFDAGRAVASGPDAAAAAAASTLRSTGIGEWFLLDLDAPLSGTEDAAFRIAAALAVPGVSFAAPVFVGNDGHWVVPTDVILLRLRPGSPDALLPSDLEVLERDWALMPGAFRLRARSRNGFEVLAAANRLARDPRVEWAEPDMQFSGRGALIPNDPGFSNLWGIRNTGQFGGIANQDMDGDVAWDITTGNPLVRVLIIDTGVELGHPDLNLDGGSDLTGQGSVGGGPFNACDNHGTAVAGCVSARINNSVGTVGIAPNCRSVSARTFISAPACDGSWTSQASWTVDALSYGLSRNCWVSNNSNYYGFTSGAIESRYSTAWSSGMVHFAAAGNFSSSTITYPASIPVVNAVAALAPTGARAAFSNYGVGLDFSAPGTNVYSTDRTGASGYAMGDYVFIQGTSFASPYAAGVAALMLSTNPAHSSAQVETKMRAACRDLGPAGYDTDSGWGFVNALSSIRRAGYRVTYGAGKAGTGGVVPVLLAAAVPVTGGLLTLNAGQTRGGTTGVVFLGFGRTAIPLLGGTLLTIPSATFGVVLGGAPGAPGAGSGAVVLPVPADPLLVGVVLDFQAVITDVGAANGFSATNGVEVAIG
jgi:subtilisin family serine protease